MRKVSVVRHQDLPVRVKESSRRDTCSLGGRVRARGDRGLGLLVQTKLFRRCTGTAHGSGETCVEDRRDGPVGVTLSLPGTQVTTKGKGDLLMRNFLENTKVFSLLSL